VRDEVNNEEIEYLNRGMKWWGQFFKGAYEIHRNYGAETWLIVVSVWLGFGVP